MKAFDDQERMEEKAHKNFQHVKNSSAPVCPKCDMPMIANKRPTGIKFVCSAIYCYNSYFEVSEK